MRLTKGSSVMIYQESSFAIGHAIRVAEVAAAEVVLFVSSRLNVHGAWGVKEEEGGERRLICVGTQTPSCGEPLSLDWDSGHREDRKPNLGPYLNSLRQKIMDNHNKLIPPPCLPTIATPPTRATRTIPPRMSLSDTPPQPPPATTSVTSAAIQPGSTPPSLPPPLSQNAKCAIAICPSYCS